MREQELELHADDLREQLLPLLRGRVFHVTSADRLKAIERSRFIRANVDGSLGNTYPQSAASLGRRNGWVCLFDLREKSESAIDWGLHCFYFLAPPPLGDHVAFLMADAEIHHRLVLSDDVVRTDGEFIPKLGDGFGSREGVAPAPNQNRLAPQRVLR